MNAQFFPGSSENLNRQTHQRLLDESANARRIRKTTTEGEGNHSNDFGPGGRQPGLLEPLVSAVLTAALAFQIALLVGI